MSKYIAVPPMGRGIAALMSEMETKGYILRKHFFTVMSSVSIIFLASWLQLADPLDTLLRIQAVGRQDVQLFDKFGYQ